MTTMYGADSSRRYVQNLIHEIQRQIKSIEKNYKDMDLENADVQYAVENVVKQMVRECNDLISELSSYRFQ